MARTKKERARINVFDVVVLLLLVCLLVTFGYRIYSGIQVDDAGRHEVKYVMEFECEAEYNSLLRYLEKGDAVYFTADGKLLGYLYEDEEHEKGAIYEIVDDIPTFANGQMNGAEKETDTEVLTDAEVETGVQDGLLYLPSPTFPVAETVYDTIKLGGQIALNIETVKVKSGGYYSIGDTNFTVGSVFEVYTDDTVFTLKVGSISIVEE